MIKSCTVTAVRHQILFVFSTKKNVKNQQVWVKRYINYVHRFVPTGN